MKDLFSVSSVVDWLKSQNLDTTYDYSDSNDCFLCRYLRSKGFQILGMAPYHWIDSSGKWHEIPDALEWIAFPTDFPSYRNALKRAEALL